MLRNKGKAYKGTSINICLSSLGLWFLIYTESNLNPGIILLLTDIRVDSKYGGTTGDTVDSVFHPLVSSSHCTYISEAVLAIPKAFTFLSYTELV